MNPCLDDTEKSVQDWFECLSGIMQRSCHFECFGTVEGAKDGSADLERGTVWSLHDLK